MFDKGRIDIILPRTGYAPGDTISGNITLVLKKPVKARGMVISLIGEQKNTRVGGMPGGKDMSSNTQRIRLYDFKQQLDTEKEYSEGHEYRFEMKIPADILSARAQMPDLDGVLGQGLKVAQAAAAMTGRIPLQRTRWYLQAKLDVPGGIDISKKADITIG
ncbi:MAG: hypothetical protein E4G93_05705 [Dehalococcoidia bacterium]|nr:MAG: hypothetical protein E4G93_05705 [Dehalococcoidia bacterium]